MKDLFDTIRLTNGDEKIGIIDYIGDDFLYFIDFTDHTYDQVLYLIVRWKAESPNERFMLYCINNDHCSQPPVVKSFNLKAIEYPEFEESPKNNYKKKKTIRLSQ